MHFKRQTLCIITKIDDYMEFQLPWEEFISE